MPLADVTPPTVRLRGKRRQLARRTIGVIVRATSEDVWSAVSGTVRIARSRKTYALKGVRERFIVRGGASTLHLSLSKKALLAIRRALRSHRSVTARVTMDARDAAGNITARKRTIALIL